MFKRDKKGFTLVELLVVISVISLLSSFVMSRVLLARQAGQDTRRVADIGEIEFALEMYVNGIGVGLYPPVATWKADLVNAGLITNVPKDPTDNTDYFYFRCTGGTRYHLGANLTLTSTKALKTDLGAIPTGCTGSTVLSVDTAACNAGGPANRYCYDVTH